MHDGLQPGFLILDTKGREAFLSQCGNFSPAERRIFHRLVAMWAPVIPYNNALAALSSDSVTAKNDLHSLMDKLALVRCGLISTHIHDGERIPLGIILCDADDLAYHSRLLEEGLLDVATDLLKPLPSLQNYRDANIAFPAGLHEVVDFNTLATLHGEKETRESRILLLECGGRGFLLNSSSIRRFVTIALAKLQAVFQNATLLSYFAQRRKQSLMELKSAIEARVPAFWIEFCAEILMARDVLKQQKKVVLDPQFFALAEFMAGFLNAQKEEILKKKKADEERRVDMVAIVENLKSASAFFRSEQEFSELIVSFKQKYPDSFPAFLDEFEKNYLEPQPKKALPVVVHLGKAYIHQENVHPFFLMRLESVGKEFFNVYVRAMEQYIRYRDESESAVFYSQANFEADLAERLRSLDPILFELLQRPNLVAEAIILSIRKHREIKNADDLKSHLAPFFIQDRIVFKTLPQLFGLNLLDIYKLAFLRTSLLRQLIGRITGKHELLLNKFADLAEGFMEAESSPRQPRNETNAPETRPDRQSRESRGKQSRHSSAKPQGAAKKPPAAAPKPVQPKLYSTDEQNNAWRAFQDRILK